MTDGQLYAKLLCPNQALDQNMNDVPTKTCKVTPWPASAAIGTDTQTMYSNKLQWHRASADGWNICNVTLQHLRNIASKFHMYIFFDWWIHILKECIKCLHKMQPVWAEWCHHWYQHPDLNDHPQRLFKRQVRWGDVPSHWFLSSESSTVQPLCTIYYT